MKSPALPCRLALMLCVLAAPAALAQDNPAPTLPAFRMAEVERSLKVGYAVKLVDVDHDGKLDIVVVDTTRVLWYQNPTWQPRVIIQGGTRPDNVCIDAHDIDGDGKVDFALGAEWKPFNTASGGTLQWLRRGKSLDDPWEVFPIDTEPTLHRVRFADVNGDGRQELIVVPLMGRGSSAANNWTDGAPVRTLAYHVPKDPVGERWRPEVLDQSLHVVHNFHPIPAEARKGMDVLMASYEGVSLVSRDRPDGWTTTRIGAGNQANPKGKRGASEIKRGNLKGGRKVIATIEPWHGDQVVVYTEPAKAGELWDRHVIDEQLRWGHAVSFADLDGDGGDELVIGVRDNPGPQDRFTERCGVRVYKCQDDAGARWSRQIVDNGGVATEDLAVGDLNGDGRPDIVAVGRATHNMRIYWNTPTRQPSP